MSFYLDDELRDEYSAHEWETLGVLRDSMRSIEDSKAGKEKVQAARATCHEAVMELWPDQLERIGKTSIIMTKDAGARLLVPNVPQVRFYNTAIRDRRAAGQPVRAIILKARQLGFSTFIQAWHYDELQANPYRTAMTLSYDDDSTREMFQKTHLIHERWPFPRPTVRDSSGVLEFERKHGSTFYTKTAGAKAAGRSFTVHHMHCSEVPMWQDAETVFTGALQAVPDRPHTSILIESTAKGAVGAFYDYWKQAEAEENDYTPFFAPWHWESEYQLPFASQEHCRRWKSVRMTSDDDKYQARFALTDEQMHWRDHTTRNKLKGDRAMFRQEYPASAEEAFLSTGMPVFNADFIQSLYSHVQPPRIVGDILLVR